EFADITADTVFPPGQQFRALSLEAFDADNDGDYDVIVGTNNEGLQFFVNSLYRPDFKADPGAVGDAPIYFDNTGSFLPNLYSSSLNPFPNSRSASGHTTTVDVGDI